jgi:flagellar hook-associated protein 1 FlgK
VASDLLSIARSGVAAASAGLDVTAQNIANVGTAGYIRRGITQTELVGANAGGTVNDVSLLGVGPAGVTRSVDSYAQAQVRNANAAAVASDTQVSGLTQIQSALEQTNLYAAITSFGTALQQLTSNPADSSLRTETLSDAQTMTQTFNLASAQLAAAGQGMQVDAASSVSQVNQLATNLAAINIKISSDSDPAANQAPLLDQRDALLQQLSQFADLTTTIQSNNTATVQLGGASGPQLVGGGATTNLAMAAAANGTISFALGGSGFAVSGGSLAGQQQSLAAVASTGNSLDAIAAALIGAANSAQTGGAALDGSAGQPLFSGTTASTIAVALTAPAQLATAPAGAPVGSPDPANLTALQAAVAAANPDPANLTALQAAVAAANPGGQVSDLLFSVSSAVHSATTTQTALGAISTSAKTALQSQSGVSLDTEAANLLRYQQAYQASGKVMQTAQTLFDALLQIIP